MIKGTTTLSAILLASLAGCAEMLECPEISGCQDFVRMSDGDGGDDRGFDPEPSRSEPDDHEEDEPDAGSDEPEGDDHDESDDDDHDESDDDENDDHDEDDEDD